MKKMMTALFLIGAMTLTATAQERGEFKKGKHAGREKHDGVKMDKMNQLNLTDAQKQQMKTIRKESKEKMQALKANRQLTLQQYDDQKAVILREQKSKIDAVLTSDQKNQMEQIKTEQRSKKSAMQDKKLDAMKNKLSLTDAQVAQRKSLQDKNQMQMKAIRENQVMGPDAKKAEIEKIQQSAMEERKKILTAEQLTKLESMKKGSFNKRRSDKQ